MENPTFKLKNIVKGSGSLEDFEGPLTLILQLLSKNKIEIRDVKISVILQQYLEYLDEMKRMDLEIASEFAAMAAHLMYIKAKVLVSGEKEVTELEQLMDSLEKLQNRELYSKIKAILPELEKYKDSGIDYIVKPPEGLPEAEYSYQHDIMELADALSKVMSRHEAENTTYSEDIIMPQRIVYPIDQKAKDILQLLKLKNNIPLKELFAVSRSRSELVAVFMAILELSKNGEVCLKEGEDGKISVEKSLQE